MIQQLLKSSNILAWIFRHEIHRIYESF